MRDLNAGKCRARVGCLVCNTRRGRERVRERREEKGERGKGGQRGESEGGTVKEVKRRWEGKRMEEREGSSGAAHVDDPPPEPPPNMDSMPLSSIPALLGWISLSIPFEGHRGSWAEEREWHRRTAMTMEKDRGP
jgi:hypothetical protein